MATNDPSRKQFHVTAYTEAKLPNNKETLESYDAGPTHSLYKVDTKVKRFDWCMILTHAVGSQLTNVLIHGRTHVPHTRTNIYICPDDSSDDSSDDEDNNDDLSEGLHLPAGQHLLVDIKNVDPIFLNSEERLAEAMIQLVDESKLTLLSYHCQ
eukprot:scaffold5862_cov91-Skeletonema_marinoi.AAC.8